MTSNDVILSIEDLHVEFHVYEGIARVLDGVSLYVRERERVGLVGETGCGKTVAMKTVMGILRSPPAYFPKGKVVLAGKDILRMGARELNALKGRVDSMVFQDPLNALNPVFTVGTQLIDVIRFGKQGRVSNDYLRKKAVEVLQAVRLPDPCRIMKLYPFELSGGMRQRVLIAMALVNRPKLLLADEPGTALDVTIQAQILSLLKSLVEETGVAILLVTHDLGVVREMTSRVYIMYAGQIVESGPTAKILDNPLHPYTSGLLAAVPRLTGEVLAEGIPGTVPDYTEAPPGCRFHPRCDFRIDQCSQAKPPVAQINGERQVACYLHSSGGLE